MNLDDGERAAAVGPAKTGGGGSGTIRHISGEQLAELTKLLKTVDGVEIKVTIPVTSHRTTIRGLPLDPVEAEPRQVFFFDTPAMDLDRAGLVVRARRIPGGAADTVIKLRPVVPKDMNENMRRSGACKVELDAMPGGYVVSASLKGRCSGEEVIEAVNGELPLQKLFSKEQRQFYRQHAPRGVDLRSLVPLGPTFVLRSRFDLKKVDMTVTAEYWLFPDGSRVLELSTKAAPNEAFQVSADFRGYLGARGIETASEPNTKTKSALQFFCSELKAADNGRSRSRRKRAV
jgi:hypothetical protein